MKGSKSTGLNRMAFFLIPLGIAVNFIGGQIVTLLKLPIFLDAVGTMLVGALCGPIYSVIVALITGLLMGITSPTALFYIGNYFAVGISAGWFARWNYFNNIWKSVIYGVIIGLVCGIFGSIVTVAAFGGFSASALGLITGFIHRTFNLSIPVSNMISEVFADIIDKIPSAIATFLIVKSIPNRFLLKLPLGNRYIRHDKINQRHSA